MSGGKLKSPHTMAAVVCGVGSNVTLLRVFWKRGDIIARWQASSCRLRKRLTCAWRCSSE
ncbi:hypothetical protein D3C83_156730 [compost metagenome]